MAQQNKMRNVQVEQLVSEIAYGNFESQSRDVYPRFAAVMERLANSNLISMSFEDDWGMLKEHQNISLNSDMVASIKRSYPIVSHLDDLVIISWIDPENSELHQFKINALAFVQIEDLKDDEDDESL